MNWLLLLWAFAGRNRLAVRYYESCGYHHERVQYHP